MSGRTGRSGRKPKPIGLHVLAGTFRRDRHAAALAKSVADEGTRHEEPPAEVLMGVGENGGAFLRAVYRENEVSLSDALVLRLAAVALDDVEAARAAGDLKRERAAVRQVLAVLQRLGWPRVGGAA